MMKNTIRKNMMSKFAAFAVILTMAITSCKKSEETVVPVPAPDPLVTTYTLKSKDLLGVTGTVSIAEKSTGSSESVITITLTGAPVGTHPAHIHMNSAIETGAIAYSLNDVDVTGKSTTILPVIYGALINFDGYVNVHLNAATLGTIIAQGDIGGNVLTGTNKTYSLSQDSASGVTGFTRFDKRKNGNTLITVDLNAGVVLPAGLYAAHINLGSVATIGIPENKKTLNPVDGATRISMTNVRTLNDGTIISYNNWMVYDGFMTIYNATDSTNVISLGNIGSN